MPWGGGLEIGDRTFEVLRASADKRDLERPLRVHQQCRNEISSIEVGRKRRPIERAGCNIDAHSVRENFRFAQALAISGIAHCKIGIVGVEKIENALRAIAINRALEFGESL